MKSYCEKNNMNVFDFVPLTFILDYKSEFIWDQLDTFKSILRIIESNIRSDVVEVNRKIH